MSFHIIQSFIRGVRRNPVFASLNIAGLALGMTCAFALGTYVWHESHYDTEWKNGDRIYRVVTQLEEPGGERLIAGNPVPLGATLAEEMPEIERVVRFWQAYQPVLRVGDKSFRDEEDLYFADPSVFDVFDLPLKIGGPNALGDPRTIVLSERFAEQFFGDSNPVGRTMEYDGYPEGRLTLTVTGVVGVLPSATHLRFDALISMKNVHTEINNWGSTKDVWTYALLHKGVNSGDVEKKLPGFVSAHLRQNDSRNRALYLQPLSEVHLDARYAGGFSTPVSRASLALASLIALAILLLACVNFTNLTTARAIARAKDMGLRKVLGARRRHLVIQVLSEILLLAVSASIVAWAASETLVLPLTESVVGTTLDLPWEITSVGAVLIIGLVTLIAGGYPALLLSGFDPVQALKGTSMNKNGFLRKVLVVGQFVISIALLAATLVIARQLEFIQTSERGITRDRIVVVPGTEHFNAFRTEMLSHPAVVEVSQSHRIPMSELGYDTRPMRKESEETQHQMHTYIVDDHFLRTYGISLIAGRPLPTVTAEGHHPFLINERALREFGWKTPEDALGQRVVWSGTYKTGEIVGVVADFTVESLHEALPPVVLTTIPDETWWRDYASIRIRGGDMRGVLTTIERTWKDLTPQGAYEYRFVDDEFSRLHRSDTRLAQFVGAGTTAAIVIACLGLLGLAMFSAQRRTKEVAVRKVLGSSVTGLVRLLVTEFLVFVAIANILAWPLAYFATQRYLETFAYKAGFSVWTYIGAAIVMLAISFLVIATQVLRAARANPIDSLRYE